jgi:hypothetical protein
MQKIGGNNRPSISGHQPCLLPDHSKMRIKDPSLSAQPNRSFAPSKESKTMRSSLERSNRSKFRTLFLERSSFVLLEISATAGYFFSKTGAKLPTAGYFLQSFALKNSPHIRWSFAPFKHDACVSLGTRHIHVSVATQ